MANLFDNERYKDWIKDSVSLLYCKESLEQFTCREVSRFHRDLLKQLGIPNTKCTTCDIDDIRKQWNNGKFTCHSNVCNRWLTTLRGSHCQPMSAHWNKNLKISNIPEDPWECAKLYLPAGCFESTCHADIDISGLMSLYINCTWFSSQLGIDNQMCKEVKNIRNRIFHSGTMEVNSSELSHDVEQMLDFLSQPIFAQETQCQEATTKIKELRTGSLDISLNRELELKAIKHKMQTMECNMRNVQHTTEVLRQDMFQESHKQQSNEQELRSLSQNMQKIKHEMNELRQKSDVLRQGLQSGTTAPDQLLTSHQQMAMMPMPQVHEQCVYRLLRIDENPARGLVAKNPLSTSTIEEHVTSGSSPDFSSRYISSCKSEAAIKRFAKHTSGVPAYPVFKGIVKIDIQKLKKDHPGIKIIDISTDEKASSHIPSSNDKARNYARCFEEVLIEDYVPAPREPSGGDETTYYVTPYKRLTEVATQLGNTIQLIPWNSFNGAIEGSACTVSGHNC